MHKNKRHWFLYKLKLCWHDMQDGTPLVFRHQASMAELLWLNLNSQSALWKNAMQLWTCSPILQHYFDFGCQLHKPAHFNMHVHEVTVFQNIFVNDIYLWSTFKYKELSNIFFGTCTKFHINAFVYVTYGLEIAWWWVINNSIFTKPLIVLQCSALLDQRLNERHQLYWERMSGFCFSGSGFIPYWLKVQASWQLL